MATAGLVTCTEGGGGKLVTLKLGLPAAADGGRSKLGGGGGGHASHKDHTVLCASIHR